MSIQQESPSQKNLPTGFSLLAKCSFTFYFISLFIPALDTWPGLKVLFYGVVYSWFLPSSWAYFANFAFFYIIVRYKKRPVNAAAILILLTLLTPAADVGSWGWGAILWVIANCLLACDIFLQGKHLYRWQEVAIITAISSLFLLPSCYLSITQHKTATDAEKEKFLKPGIAFTVASIKGIDEQPPPKLKLNKDTVIEMVGSKSCKNKRFITDHQFSILAPRFYQYKNQFIQYFETSYEYPIYIYSPAKPVDYYFGIKRREKNKKLADIFILDKHKKPLWTAPVALVRHRLYPSHIRYNYWDGVLDKIDYHDGKYVIQGREIPSETVDKTCPFEVTSENPIKKEAPSVVIWDEKKIEFSQEYGEIKRALCSENYVFFISRSKRSYDLSYYVNMNIVLFDRHSMYPLYKFSETYSSSYNYQLHKKKPIKYLIVDDPNFSSINSITFTPYEYLKEDAHISIDTQKDGVVVIESDEPFD